MKRRSPAEVPPELEERSFSALRAFFFEVRPRSRISLSFKISERKDPGSPKVGAVVRVRITQTTRKNLKSAEKESFFSVRIKVNPPKERADIFDWRGINDNMGWEKVVKYTALSPICYPMRMAVWGSEPDFLEVRILEVKDGFWVAFGWSSY